MISADRPFGILLYPYFEKAYEAVVGSPASSFKFVSKDTPFSTDKQTYGACLTYLIVVLSFRYLMRNQKPFSLTLLFRIHNLILTFISLALFLLISEQFIPPNPQSWLLLLSLQRECLEPED
ncbi:Fatty acyl-CoA elongase/Polyunsaturated fatty acid specific elongation enzyme [Entomophthora muscae]|uniref:Fatty acyl-CoA elongase/Polyunsaturated fatty acid specific elongation enzyme n=1 Tax=Entomophthora muscae TaxID=34485 RepID=A0ACC2U917_9FUNG|nr:Fatty acyl-CoA elongase/Polyunsaturated fatty acid specific elongation enzyme [Entomophthora muscae]